MLNDLIYGINYMKQLTCLNLDYVSRGFHFLRAFLVYTNSQIPNSRLSRIRSKWKIDRRRSLPVCGTRRSPVVALYTDCSWLPRSTKFARRLLIDYILFISWIFFAIVRRINCPSDLLKLSHSPMSEKIKFNWKGFVIQLAVFIDILLLIRITFSGNRKGKIIKKIDFKTHLPA